MEISRSAGVLLHPSQLPGPLGVGELGQAARDFVDVLATVGVGWWQILPLTPPDSLGSPYASNSAFASDANLIDLRELIDDGLLSAEDLAPLHEALEGEAEDEFLVGLVTPVRAQILKSAFAQFEPEKGFEAFVEAESYWLEDYALFSALKRDNQGKHWAEWDSALVRRDPDALAAAEAKLESEILQAKFEQWLFAKQWDALLDYARSRGVRVIGDIPIFVAMDSSDVWANRANFDVDESGQATAVAGVPPDYFSETGQLWGNPLYDWASLESTEYKWWTDRVRRALAQVDLIRIDHFRGFESFWAVPAGAPNAIQGEWRKGPADAFFEAIKEALGELPFIAEDLGIITQAVTDLRRRQELPGMRVMHFAFDGNPDHPFLPHTYPKGCVAYLGTHDNDTTMGWYWSESEPSRHRVRTYFSCSDEDVLPSMMTALAKSEAELIVYTAQDILGLGAFARTNTPGTSDDNWSWRLTQAQLDDDAWRKLGVVLEEAGRLG